MRLQEPSGSEPLAFEPKVAFVCGRDLQPDQQVTPACCKYSIRGAAAFLSLLMTEASTLLQSRSVLPAICFLVMRPWQGLFKPPSQLKLGSSTPQERVWKAMDYNQVAPEFRRYALGMQIAILGCLALYSAYGMYQIIDSIDTPPVKSHYVHWGNPGVFMVCATIGELHGVGVGLPPPTLGRSDWRHSHNWTYRGGGVQFSTLRSAPNFDGSETADKKTCSMVDLTSWDMPEPPLSFSICHDAARANLLAWNGISWDLIQELYHHGVKIFGFSKRRHGLDSGYRETYQEIFQVALHDKWANGGHNHSDSCPGQWKRFSSSTGGEGVYIISIQDPLVETTTKQGVVPQVVALVGNLGGYLTLSGTLFALVWVRRYPGSEVNKTFEARTLVGHAEDVERGGRVADTNPRDSSNGGIGNTNMTPTVLGKLEPDVANQSCGLREQKMPDPPWMKASE